MSDLLHLETSRLQSTRWVQVLRFPLILTATLRERRGHGFFLPAGEETEAGGDRSNDITEGHTALGVTAPRPWVQGSLPPPPITLAALNTASQA